MKKRLFERKVKDFFLTVLAFFGIIRLSRLDSMAFGLAAYGRLALSFDASSTNA